MVKVLADRTELSGLGGGQATAELQQAYREVALARHKDHRALAGGPPARCGWGMQSLHRTRPQLPGVRVCV